LDNNEDPESAIKREILEETGYRTNVLIYISTFYVSPGGCSERIFLYFAAVYNKDKILQGGGLTSEGEDISTLDLTLTELRESLDSGKIVDAKTIIATMWLLNKVEDK
jgi:ADP-ribose pyrophosphatase